MENKTLSEIKKIAENIAGCWNGDNPGTQEDNAHVANDILETVKKLEDLLRFCWYYFYIDELN